MTVQSPYRRGADDGLWFGLYLSVMFFSSILSGRVAMLSLLSLALVVGVPAVIYFFMRAYDRRLGPAGTFPMLWMHGVVIFFCGMLIAGCALVVYMKWIEPGFVIGQIRSVAALKGTLPDTGVETAAEVASDMLAANFIPTPVDIVVELMMLAIFTGSLLSMMLSAVFAFRRRRKIFG